MNKWMASYVFSPSFHMDAATNFSQTYIKKISIELGNGKNINLFGCHSDCHSRVSRE
jgi:5-methylcytosine-specific restriction endonuclease McrA